MKEQELAVKFNNSDTVEANKYAKEFQRDLDQIENIQIKLRKDNADTMDFGATLVLVLGAPAIVALAEGIADYIRRRPNAELEIECNKKKTIKFKGTSEDAAKITEALKELCD